MALLTPTNLETMDYAYQAQPFVDVPSKSAINLETMDYAYQAQPFVSNDYYYKFSQVIIVG
jgi:hypothetical protein